MGGQERSPQGEAGYPISTRFARRGLIFSSSSAIPSMATACVYHRRIEPGSNFIAASLTEYRAKHHYQRGAAALRRLLESVPVYVIWDDHEVDNFTRPFETQMAAGRQAFREYWPIHADVSEPNRLYRTIRYGSDLEMFLLDTRQYRSRNAKPSGPAKTMLGRRTTAVVTRRSGGFHGDMEGHCHERALVRSEGRRVRRPWL